jgi:hypothetical protein
VEGLGVSVRRMDLDLGMIGGFYLHSVVGYREGGGLCSVILLFAGVEGSGAVHVRDLEG